MAILEDALRFGGFVMAHASWIVSDLQAGELLCPIAIVTMGDERRVIPFEARTQEEALARGKASFEELKDSVDSWALAREGVVALPGEELPKHDVLTVSSWVQGLDEPVLLQHLFTPRSKGGFELVGPVEIAIHGAKPPHEVCERLRPVVMQGIALHPHGNQWPSWSGGRS